MKIDYQAIRRFLEKLAEKFLKLEHKNSQSYNTATLIVAFINSFN